MTQRFTPEHLATWRRDGCAPIEGFFTPEEVAAVRADFVAVFGRESGAEAALERTKDGETGRFHPSQFKGIQTVPLDCSPALNLIGVHPALISFAKQALSTEAVHIYQCNAWAKFAGEADYDQPFHCDFVNHTLTAPAQDAHLNAVTILCYFTDVTDAHGAMNYVTRPDSAGVAGPEATLDQSTEHQAWLQGRLRQHARSSAAPAGSIVPYGIDIYHRGTNITVPHGIRYAVMACFKAASNDAIGYHAWPFHHLQPWANIFDHATPEQLACFGVPLPGNPFWTAETIRRSQARYPGWDVTSYRAALLAAA